MTFSLSLCLTSYLVPPHAAPNFSLLQTNTTSCSNEPNLLVEAQQHPLLREHGELLPAALAGGPVPAAGACRQHDKVGPLLGRGEVGPLGDERGYAAGAREAAGIPAAAAAAALRPSAVPGAGACSG